MVFQLFRPSSSAIRKSVARAQRLPTGCPPYLSLHTGLAKDKKVPLGFSLDLSRSRLGFGEEVFQAAREAFLHWTMFDLGWVRVANPATAIAPGAIVAVEARTLGLWSLNLCRILEVADTPTRFGFLYAATTRHVERGEERFVLDYDLTNGEVRYEIEALSRPASALAALGFPIARRFQHRFARDSHRRLYREIAAARPAIQ